jgi:hypothetical protein
MKAIAKCVTVLALALTAAAPCAADPVRIIGGALVFDGDSLLDFDPVRLTGTRGFTFEGNTGFGVFAPDVCLVAPCAAGSPLSIFAHWVGMDLGGTTTLEGRTYLRTGSASSDNSLSVTFDGSVVVPAVGSGSAVTTTPFTFTGRFFAFGLPDAAFVDLIGQGIATASFVRRDTGLPGIYLERLSYDFVDPAAAPEPSTFMLVAGGAALAAWRRQARKKEEGRWKK